MTVVASERGGGGGSAMRWAWATAVCLGAALAAEGAAAAGGRRSDPDFEFADDASAAGGAGGAVRRARSPEYEPAGGACGARACSRRRTCVVRGGAPLCVDTRALLRAGDVIVSASGAGAAAGAEDDDVFYDAAAGAEAPHARADDAKPDRCVGCGAGGGGGGGRAQFVCGSDNRTYSSLCRLDLHNCVRRPRPAVAARCRGFCPCAATPAAAARGRTGDDYEEPQAWRRRGGGGGGAHAVAHNEVLPARARERSKRRRLSKGVGGAGAACELDKMADRLLDWFSVLMEQARGVPPPARGFPRECKPETRWMFAHLDTDGDGLLSARNLYALRHDERERCLRPFLESCGGGGAGGGVPRGAWCACLRRAARPCTALARAHPSPRAGAYVPSCDARGFYAPRQCHPALGVCWCATPHGAERPGTRARGAPACPPHETDELSNAAGEEGAEGAGGVEGEEGAEGVEGAPADDEDAGGSGDAELRV